MLKVLLQVLQITQEHDARPVRAEWKWSGPPNKSSTLVYNRINKSGSTSLLGGAECFVVVCCYASTVTTGQTPAVLLSSLAVENRFHLVGQGGSQLRYLQPRQKLRLARLLCQQQDKVVCHFSYLMLENSGM